MPQCLPWTALREFLKAHTAFAKEGQQPRSRAPSTVSSSRTLRAAGRPRRASGATRASRTSKPRRPRWTSTLQIYLMPHWHRHGLERSQDTSPSDICNGGTDRIHPSSYYLTLEIISLYAGSYLIAGQRRVDTEYSSVGQMP